MVQQFEGLRGVAAFAVFIYHFHHVPALAPITNRLSGFFGTGWIFVDLFFILSGWVMGHVYHQRLLSEPGAVHVFLIARIARLYPLLLASVLAWCAIMPMLGVVVHWDRLGACLPQLLTLSFTWGPLTCPIPVAPAWSISAEAAVYLVFPLLLWTGMTQTLVRTIALTCLGVLGYAIFALSETGIHVLGGTAPLRAACGFAIGLGLWRLGDMGFSLQGRMATNIQIISLIGIIALLVLGRAPFAILLLFSVLVLTMVSGTGPFAKFCQIRPLVTLGRLSFSIYLWHWFAIIWMQQVALPIEPYILAAIAVALVVFWAHVSYVFIEAPGRRAIRSALAPQTAKLERVHSEDSL